MRDDTLNIAIIGMGPRGLSVLERLVARLTQDQGERPVRILTVDPGEMGAGRIWRTDQSEWLLMNTAAGEVSLFSGGPDAGPWRAGAGPSLYEWLCARPGPEGESASPNGYMPRRLYGTYLRDVFAHVTANLPAGVTVVPVQARARNLHRQADGGYLLVTSDGRKVHVDKAVLTTGHSHSTAGGSDRDLLDFASRHRRTTYLRGGSAADMDLEAVEPGRPVAIIGLGLTFYDVVAELTSGRGGHYDETTDGELQYVPSGNEPQIVAGSRSGLPLLARGRNQKAGNYRYTPKFLTTEAVAQARKTALSQAGSVQLRFREHVLPLMLREVEHIYYTTHMRLRDGDKAAADFAARHLCVAGDTEATSKLLAETGLADIAPIDLENMARPFAGEYFDSTDQFHQRLVSLLSADAAQAEEGNIDGPLKAALDILRDTRGVVREAVEFSSLHPDSHRSEFLAWFNPINTMVSAGPPAVRIRQAIALIRAGILTVVGPGLTVETDEDTGHFVLESPQVADARHTATVLVDARIPRSDIRTDASPLMRQLIDDGLATTHVNINAQDGARFATGALAVTTSPYHVVDAAGRPSKGLYALGIPTEELRWFTQIGNGRPGPMVGFHNDADAIAGDMLATPRRIGATTVPHTLPTTRLTQPIEIAH